MAGLWMSGRLANLTDDLGNCIEVICPGRPGTNPGCDFQDAVIRVNRQKIIGDIEVHVTSDLWVKHGHHKDAACNGVVLHVAMWQKGGLPVKLQDGRILPTVILSRYILNIYGAKLRRWESCGIRPCVHSNGPSQGIDTILLIEGLRRFEEKSARFSDLLKTAEAGQVLYKGICRALGYARNKAPFEALADRLPLAAIFQLAGSSLLSKQAVLLGAAGLLPSQREMINSQCCAGDAEELEGAWSRLSDDILPGKASDWSLTFVRPVNNPVRRIAALSYLLQRYEESGLLQGLKRLAGSVQAGAAKKLTAGLQVNGGCYEENPPKCCEESSDEAIPGHCAHKNVIARSPQVTKQSIRRGQIAAPSGLAMTMEKLPATTMGKAPDVLIGRGRAGEIAINVILPFFTALARHNKDTRLENTVQNTYLHYPPLPSNELTRYMSVVLLGRRDGKSSGCLQQGLIRLYHRYCRVKDCECCPVFISRKPARV